MVYGQQLTAQVFKVSNVLGVVVHGGILAISYYSTIPGPTQIKNSFAHKLNLDKTKATMPLTAGWLLNRSSFLLPVEIQTATVFSRASILRVRIQSC